MTQQEPSFFADGFDFSLLGQKKEHKKQLTQAKAHLCLMELYHSIQVVSIHYLIIHTIGMRITYFHAFGRECADC